LDGSPEPVYLPLRLEGPPGKFLKLVHEYIWNSIYIHRI